jgi:hypothetical protein
MTTLAADSPYTSAERRSDVFLINPNAHSKFYRGETKRIGNSTVMLGIAMLCLFALFAVVFTSIRENQRLQGLLNNGETVRGEIVDGRSVTGRRGGTTYYVTYEYRVDGREYRYEQQISGDHWDEMYIGARVEVIYDPANPATSVLGGEDLDMTSTNNMMLGAGLGGLALLGLAGVCIWNDARNRTVSTKGQILHGQIVNATGRNGSKGAFNITVEYQFNTPDGRQLTKKTTMNRPDLKKVRLPMAGTPVAVLYVSDKQLRLM